GIPNHPSTLMAEGHRMVGFHSSATGTMLPLVFLVDGHLSHITLPSSLSLTAADSYYAAAQMGLGLIQVPRYRAEADLAAGTLVEILHDYPPQPSPVSLLYPSGRQLSP